ncbi:type III PLP-dependent enzyme [Kibdelosporangium phytohabitans]|uniref:Diaminopimelate decarboxylase n=1 Tax=Kibdelosporangium phytohabitans TaxID=860235 RepID=A0A0N9I325_9PSEU|nr:type III PLP-dependent enzyme [Kibdelosporangium phytohabitans]ALG10441.1 diaminopimelate decarboxylase [Kibdelosporangium phytohabitans]MBE1461513.1 diaminopimelate decarboxylase [Kibdelosporangium phytohabitans]
MTEEFTVQGHRISDLAERFGTPMYLYDGDVLRDVYTNLRGGLHPGVDIFYSAKANPNVSICAVLRSLGAGIEVSSLTELITARKAGAGPQEIIFLGPGKSAAELDACLEHGIHAIVCESLDELTTLDALKPPADVRVLLRVNPAFTAKGALLSMGGKPRQFGIDEAAVRGSADLLKSLKHVRPSGVHAYMGTRILKAESIVENTRGILAMAGELSSALGFPLDTVDIGGGLGVPYFENEKDLDLAETVTGVNAAVQDFLERRPGTRIITELGRYLVGWSGTYVTRARYVKESMGEWFVVADGGTNHHMAAVGIGSFVKRNFPIRSLTRYNEPAVQQYNITGPLCTPNDVVGKSVALPQVRPGDLLGVQRSGAYGPTASPVHFLSHGYPAEVLVLDGEAHLIRSPDTADDLLARQHLISL